MRKNINCINIYLHVFFVKYVAAVKTILLRHYINKRMKKKTNVYSGEGVANFFSICQKKKKTKYNKIVWFCQYQEIIQLIGNNVPIKGINS